MSPFQGPFCVISDIEAAGSVKLNCLAALGGPVTHITVNSVAEADQMIWLTFCTFAALVMIGLPLLVILSQLLTFARSRINRKEQGKMESLGYRRLDPDLEMFFSKRAVDVMTVEESLGYFRKEKLE